jgi:hypothetical protein
VTPTVRGPITPAFETADGGLMDLAVAVPGNTSARVSLPAPSDRSRTVWVDRVPREGTVEGDFVSVDVDAGCHVVSTRGAGDLPHSVQAVARRCDVTPPEITVPTDQTITAAGPDGAVATFEDATAIDIVDGTVAVACDAQSGTTFAPGATTVTCSATDASGNAATASFDVTVEYAWEGFLAPIDNVHAGGELIFNEVNAGSAVPVKFRLGGDMGLNVLRAGSSTSRAIPCTSGADPDPVDEVSSATRSGLSYEEVANQYVYVWKTDASFTGCRQLVVALADGTVRRANFKFRK